MPPILTELVKAGLLSSTLSIAAILLTPPYQEVNVQRANCAEIVEAESYSLALVANPDRILLGAGQSANDNYLWKLVDEKTQIINAKAAAMGAATPSHFFGDGPGVKAVREFLKFAKDKKNNFTPPRGTESQEHWKKISAVQSACKEQYSSFFSLPLNILGIW